MTIRPTHSQLLRATTALLGFALLAGCALPEADGLEAQIDATVAGMPDLGPGKGRDVASVARNGLLLDPEVRSAASEIKASADEVRVQRAALFPSLGLTVGGGVGSIDDDDDGAILLTGEQLLLDFGKTRRAVTIADLDMQINYIAFQQGVDDALVDVLTAYDTVRMYVLLLDVRQKQLAAMRDLEVVVNDRINAGATTTSDSLEIRKRILASEFLVHDTEFALAEARDRLSRLSGQPRGGRLPSLRSSCTSPSESDDVRIARLKLARSNLMLEAAEKARVPRVVLSPVAKQEVGHSTDFGLNVSLNSDLLEGGALSARVNAARNARDAAIADEAATRRDAALDDRALLREISSAEQKVKMLDRQIALLAETRKLYRSQYVDLGTRQVTDLLDNEEEYYNRQAEKIEVRSSLSVHHVECATRDRSLRKALGLNGSNLYGYPLTPDAI
ncbi:TolC family protein [Rhodobacteraceae bacterium KMM 6894]|nr:TolC family protein [Rhodobacteraceae bacterium KMM 6894]